MATYRVKNFIEAEHLKPDCNNIQDIYVFINGRKFWDKYVKTPANKQMLIQSVMENGLPFPNANSILQEGLLFPNECLIKNNGHFIKMRPKEFYTLYEKVEEEI